MVRTNTARMAGRSLALGLLSVAACARGSSTASMSGMSGMPAAGSSEWMMAIPTPAVDPRVGLRAGMFDAAEAVWNMRVVSETRPSPQFMGSVNSDLAFTGNYAIQGSYNGYQIWDISTPAAPVLKVGNYCPASQSDVSTYKNLLFVSAEGNTGRIDCGAQGVKDPVSAERIRGVRIFDITDIAHPRSVANIQTCRGSHTHTVLVDPNDRENVYVYVSGSSAVRSDKELPGCSNAAPTDDPNSAHFRIEVIKVPLAHPEQSAIVSSPRIFQGLAAPPEHGDAPDDAKELQMARAKGAFIGNAFGQARAFPDAFVKTILDSMVTARGGSGSPTRADSAALRTAFQGMLDKRFGAARVRTGPDQCHDITVYPAIGYAGGACGGYGLLLDIKDPAHPTRVGAVADSNFSYWHSATFNNDGTKVLFSDEWGGGGAAKCRASDPKEWGADAIFTLESGRMVFQSYYKLPAPQTVNENCVAHNGSLIPIPGRDVMAQSWYQGGISLFDWTDAKHPREIGFFDRGPVDSTHMGNAGTWSVYWYNGVLVSSEISRGLDIVELIPSPFLSKNEIDAAKTVRQEYLNTQGQPKFVWPATFALARAYVDQIERSKELSRSRIEALRTSLTTAENASGVTRRTELETVTRDLRSEGKTLKVGMLVNALNDLANLTAK